MSDDSRSFFVRRGTSVNGPVAQAKIVALLKNGTLRPTDEVAPSAAGPWVTLQKAVRQPGADVPVVEAFTIKRGMFGGGYVATFACLGCRETLSSREEEWAGIETCPTCNKRFRISPRAAEQAREERAQQERDRAAAAEQARQQRERQEADRQAAAAAKEESKRAQAESDRVLDAATAAQAANLVAAAAAARRRAGACWYCGCPRIGTFPQCPSCRIVGRPRTA